MLINYLRTVLTYLKRPGGGRNSSSLFDRSLESTYGCSLKAAEANGSLVWSSAKLTSVGLLTGSQSDCKAAAEVFKMRYWKWLQTLRLLSMAKVNYRGKLCVS